jgi:hypothetical protein
MPDDVVTNRARRADFAMGDQSPGLPQLKDAFASGQEPQVRTMAAGQANAEIQQAKLNSIKAIVQSKTPVTGQDINTLMAVGKAPEANPETVIEDKFARNYVSSGVIGDPEKNLVFQSAFERQPDSTRNNIQLGQAMTSRSLQAKNFLEEVQAQYDQTPWFNTDPEHRDQEDKAGDLIKNFLGLGFRQYALQRNLVNQSPNNSILPGSNKLEQIQYLYLLPQDQFLPALKAAAGPGSDLWKSSPSNAMDFIKAATSFSTSDAYVDNAFAIVNAGTVLPIGGGMRAIGRIAGGREVPSLALQTAEDVLKTSPRPPVTPTGAAEGVAKDILSSPSTPPAQRYYIPEAAVRNFPGAKPQFGRVEVHNGVPWYFKPDGTEVPVSRTPTEGTVPFTVEPGQNVNTFTTKTGVHEFSPEGVKSPGEDVHSPTIYVNKANYEKLSQVLDEDKNYTLLKADNGDYHIGDLNNQSPGKRVPNTIVKAKDISSEPREGLYPVRLPEGTKSQFEDFGSRITSVNKNQPYSVKFDKTLIAPKEEVETRKALADIVKSSGEDHPQDALTKMGQQENAAKGAAVQELRDKISELTPRGDVEAIRRNIPSLTSPQTFYQNSSSLSRELKDRLVSEAQGQVNELASALQDPVRVERMTGEALSRAVDNVKEIVRNKYNRASNSILDQVTHWDGQSNTYAVETKFGKKDGTLFDSSAQAKNVMDLQYRLGKSATVQQEGNKFYISHFQHVDETFKPARDGLIVSENETPRGFWNSLLNAVTGKLGGLGSSIRSSRYTVSDFQMNNRVVATHAPSVLNKAIDDTAKAMGGFTQNERHELQRILEINRDFMHEDGRRGQFYKTAQDFENAFHDVFGKMPTEKQIAGYDSFVRLSDLDWLLRAQQMHRDKARLGIRNYKVSIPSTDEVGLPTNAKTDWFNAKKVENFDPVNTQDANIYVTPESRFTTKFGDTVLDREMKAKIKSGEYQVLQVANPREKPLMGITGHKDDIHFVVTDAFEDKAIRLGEDMPYEPGGHVIYQDPYFMKMPQIGIGSKGRPTHFGDISVKTFATRREGEAWVAKYNEAREHLLNGREAELQAMFDKGTFPETAPEFKKWFTGGSFGVDTKHPFVLTTAGRDTFQSSEELAKAYPGLREQYSSYNLSQNYNKEFLADRDRQLDTIQNRGTESNPQYANVPSRLYDPYIALQKGISQIVRERWMGDYKTSAAESWVNEFWHLFPQNTLPRDKILQNPWYWTYNAIGNLDAGKALTNPELYTAAMVSRKNILNFLGARDEVGSIVEGLQKRVIDWLEPKIGPKAAGRLEETILPAIKNAPQYARAAAFNAVDGLFNPVQLIQQGQGLAHVLALSPVNGLKGATGSTLARLYRATEDAAILQDAAKKAKAMGWNGDHWLEALEAWKKTGVHNIGGEVSLQSTIGDPNLFQSGTQKFLDKGRLFFKASEAIVRDNAFFTAYQDWRTKNPTAVFDNRAIGDVLNRFDTLSMNMTRASNASYNEGVLSIPTQFWTWNARFTEQMLGKQLTWGEKSRVLGMYSALYGIPATMGGVGFGVIPGLNYADIRKYALANGYNVHDKYFDALDNGIPTMLTNIITGHETDLQRFSPEFNNVRDVLDGKKDVASLLVGASGGFMANVASSLYPFMRFGAAALQGKPNDFPLKLNDLMNVAENVSSLNNLEKLVVGLHAGKLWSKKEMLIDSNIDTFEAFMMGMGLNPKRDSDAFLRMDYLKGLKQVQESLRPQILENWKLAQEAMARGDVQSMMDFMTRTKSLSALADMSMQDQAKMFKQAMHGNEDLVDQAERMWQQNLPQLRQTPQYMDYMKNIQKHNQVNQDNQ